MNDKNVVAKLYRLGKDGDTFNKEYKTPIRTRVIVEREYVEQSNEDWQKKGQLYEVDEKATKERWEKLFQPKKPTGRPRKQTKE